MMRRKITASPVKVTGYAPDDQPFESALEEDFFFLLRFNQQVKRWYRPEKPLAWRDAEGKPRQYTPDVVVEMHPTEAGTRGATILAEVKPDFDPEDDRPVARLPRREDDEENKLKWKAAQLFAARRGWTFRVYREKDIRNEYLENAKFLLRHLERPLVEHGREALLAALRRSGPLPLGRLVEEASSSAEEQLRVYPTLYRMMATHDVVADLTKRLTRDTVCSLPHAS